VLSNRQYELHVSFSDRVRHVAPGFRPIP
jgi:hypothetical protein